MFGYLKSRSVIVLLTVILAVVPTVAQAGSSLVTISVPPTQYLEGTTSHSIAPDSTIQRGHLIIKSNIPWVLVARISGNAGQVVWRPAGMSAWHTLGATTELLRGVKGVHAVEYELQVTSDALRNGMGTPVLTFSVEPGR